MNLVSRASRVFLVSRVPLDPLDLRVLKVCRASLAPRDPWVQLDLLV